MYILSLYTFSIKTYRKTIKQGQKSKKMKGRNGLGGSINFLKRNDSRWPCSDDFATPCKQWFCDGIAKGGQLARKRAPFTA